MGTDNTLHTKKLDNYGKELENNFKQTTKCTPCVLDDDESIKMNSFQIK